jgi:SNF2 family DNA or RNA helicase
LRTYGTVKLDEEENKWVIDCEPQVSMRIKSVFDRVEKAQFGTIKMLASDLNSRELEWFLERYPMEVEDEDELSERSERHKEKDRIIAKILAEGYAPPKFDLAVPARDYQLVAADLLLKTGRLLVADDLGIGKTATSICTLTDERTLPALVVTLTHLPTQWEAEIAKFAPQLNCHIIKKGSVYDVTKGKRGKVEPFPDVFIINYHKLRGWAEHLAPVVNSVIFDECQELRREGTPQAPSQKYKAAMYISEHTDFSMGLSATPIYNYGGEIFNVMNCIAPGCLGSKEEFIREWCIASWQGEDKAKIRDPKAFGMYLREQGLMLRRTRGEVGRELDSLTIIPHKIECDLEALKKVEDSAAELAGIILSQQGMAKGVKMQAAEQLSNVLRQATGIAKAPYVAAFVQLLVESGERVVLYGWHRAVYGIWNAQLKRFKPAMYTGSESTNQKLESKRRFCDGETDIMIISLRSGAGLDGLQYNCRTVVYGELDWSPGVHDQDTGRVHRDGQPDPVAAYFLLAEEGSDPIMADVLGVKKQQAMGVMNPKADLISKLQTDGGNAKKLATSFLKQRGMTIPEKPVAVDLPPVANVRRPRLPKPTVIKYK